MLNIYSLLIPIKNTDLFWIVEVGSYINITNLNNDKSFNYLCDSHAYFLPFIKCNCESHMENPKCIKYMCLKVNVKFDQLLGFVFISNRLVDSQFYTFYVILCQPISLEGLGKIGIGFSLNNAPIPLLGPEVVIALKRIAQSSKAHITQPLSILPLDGVHQVSLTAFLNTIESSNVIHALYKDTEYPMMKIIYSQFMSFSYPSYEMGIAQFSQFMISHNVDRKNIPIYFRCFDTASEGFLTYEKFLIGVTCMDFNTVHGGQTGELRCRYIFSFYDCGRKGFLRKDDIKKMIIDINTKKGRSIHDDAIEVDTQEAFRVFEVDPNVSNLDLDRFLIVVGNLLFRGTSVLFRFDSDVSFSTRYLANETIISRQNISIDVSSGCLSEKLKKNDEKWEYTLAVHSAKVEDDDLKSVRPIWEDIHNIDQLGEFGDKYNLTYLRLHSMNTFKKDSCPNEILRSLRYFRYPDHINNKRKMSWGDVSMELLAKYINLLCDDVANIVAKEPRLIEIQSPTYVLGDLHGNFGSLAKFEDVLWRLGIGLSPGNFLFLGDYVDRGKYGLEVVAYLFAQKVLHPNQFYLLRGNHEVRNIQEQYTFKRECVDKFGNECGTCVWNTINIVFDMLPLAAIIDDRLFCVHGGIPRPSLVLSNESNADPLFYLRQSINGIQIPLSDPERKSSLAWEIMWSDPDREENFDIGSISTAYDISDGDAGFIKNQKRKTAFCFNQMALESFLSRYRFSHVIRAHEVHKMGFNIEHHAKLVTVFSSSDYCNNNNEAACVLVSNKKLRLIRMDTGE